MSNDETTKEALSSCLETISQKNKDTIFFVTYLSSNRINLITSDSTLTARINSLFESSSDSERWLKPCEVHKILTNTPSSENYLDISPQITKLDSDGSGIFGLLESGNKPCELLELGKRKSLKCEYRNIVLNILYESLQNISSIKLTTIDDILEKLIKEKLNENFEEKIKKEFGGAINFLSLLPNSNDSDEEVAGFYLTSETQAKVRKIIGKINQANADSNPALCLTHLQTLKNLWA